MCCSIVKIFVGFFIDACLGCRDFPFWQYDVNPMTYDYDMLCAAKKKIKNPVWSEIYEYLRKCRLNIVQVYSAEYLTLPVYGEPDIMGNLSSIKQDWCKNLQIYQISDKDRIIKNAQSMTEGKKPLSMEINALRIAKRDKLEILRV